MWVYIGKWYKQSLSDFNTFMCIFFWLIFSCEAKTSYLSYVQFVQYMCNFLDSSSVFIGKSIIPSFIISKIIINKTVRIHMESKYQTTDNTRKVKKEESLTEKMKRSPDERNTNHGSLIEMFQWSQISFSTIFAMCSHFSHGYKFETFSSEF